jgi:hypothetical protein
VIVFFNFIIFYYFIYFSGRGIIVLIEKIYKDNIFDQEFFGLKISNFYTFIFLFCIGNLTFIINFFTNISSTILLFTAFPLLFANLINLKFSDLDIYNIPTITKTFTFFSLSISSYSANLGYDAGLYHLATQLWIKVEKINIGIANFHHRLGFSSIYDYISSNFWLNENLIYLHFINLVFITQLFLNLIDYFFKSTYVNLKIVSILVLIYSFLDNFGLNGGKNGFIEIEGITKFDTPFGIIFAISMFFIFHIVVKNSFTKLEMNLMVMMVLFSIQIRPTGLLLIVPYSLIYLKYRNKIKFSILINKVNLLALLISILWTIKNILISGCGIFPIEFLCIDKLKWYESGYANSISTDIGRSLKAYNLNINFFDWYSDWSNKFYWNQSTLINFILSIVFLIIFIKLISKNSKLINSKSFYLIWLHLMYFIFWIFSAPDFRFSIGFILSIVFLIGLTTDISELKLNNKVLTFIFLILYMPSIAFLPKLENYTMFFDRPFEFRNIKVEDQILPASEYVKKDIGYGVERVNLNEVCLLRLDCSPSYEIPTKIKKILNYKMYYHFHK